MTATPAPAENGRDIPPEFGVIEVHVAEMNRLFNALDPAPFRDRDLDPKAEEFIVDSGREFPADQPLALVVHLDREPGTADDVRVLGEAVHAYFTERALATRRRLRQLLRVGRKSLLISFIFLAALMALRDLLGGVFGTDGYASILKEGLVIMGWVAIWRPMEIFLYDWWPIRAEVKLYERLSTMQVRVVNMTRPRGEVAAGSSQSAAGETSIPPRN